MEIYSSPDTQFKCIIYVENAIVGGILLLGDSAGNLCCLSADAKFHVCDLHLLYNFCQPSKWKADTARIETVGVASFGSPNSSSGSVSLSFFSASAQTNSFRQWRLNFDVQGEGNLAFSCGTPKRGVEVKIPSPSLSTVWALSTLQTSASTWLLLAGDSFGKLFLFLYEEFEKEGDFEYEVTHIQTIKDVHGKQRASAIYFRNTYGDCNIHNSTTDVLTKVAETVFCTTVITGGRNGRVCEFSFALKELPNTATEKDKTQKRTAKEFLTSLHLVKTYDAKGYKNMDMIEEISSPLSR